MCKSLADVRELLLHLRAVRLDGAHVLVVARALLILDRGQDAPRRAARAEDVFVPPRPAVAHPEGQYAGEPRGGCEGSVGNTRATGWDRGREGRCAGRGARAGGGVGWSARGARDGESGRSTRADRAGACRGKRTRRCGSSVARGAKSEVPRVDPSGLPSHAPRAPRRRACREPSWTPPSLEGGGGRRGGARSVDGREGRPRPERTRPRGKRRQRGWPFRERR